MMVKYFLLWFPMILIAILNGLAREYYKSFTGEFAARQISTISLIIFFGVYILWVVNRFPMQDGRHAILVGVLWLILTLVFEFGFGLYRGNSWGTLLSEYNIFEGKLWILIPVWVTIAPYVLSKFR